MNNLMTGEEGIFWSLLINMCMVWWDVKAVRNAPCIQSGTRRTAIQNIPKRYEDVPHSKSVTRACRGCKSGTRRPAIQNIPKRCEGAPHSESATRTCRGCKSGARAHRTPKFLKRRETRRTPKRVYTYGQNRIVRRLYL